MAKRFTHRPRQYQMRGQVFRVPRTQTLGGAYQQALNKANRKNEERYRDILSGYDALHGRVMGDLAGVGTQQSADIDREYRNLGSNVYQSLVNRGMGNSSLLATMQQGVSRERLSAQNRLAEQLATQRARFDTGITEGKLGVMERRTDAGPDPSQLIALSQALGQGGYGQGAYGGGFGGGGGFGAQLRAMQQQGLMNHLAGVSLPVQGLYGGGGGYRRARPPRDAAAAASRRAYATQNRANLRDRYLALAEARVAQRQDARNAEFEAAMQAGQQDARTTTAQRMAAEQAAAQRSYQQQARQAYHDRAIAETQAKIRGMAQQQREYEAWLRRQAELEEARRRLRLQNASQEGRDRRRAQRRNQTTIGRDVYGNRFIYR